MSNLDKKLDEILDSAYGAGYTMAQLHVRGEGNTRRTLTSDTLYKAKQSLLDWRNKQVEEVLDRLEAQWGETIDNTLGKPIRIKFVSVEAIQAERAKLKEVV